MVAECILGEDTEWYRQLERLSVLEGFTVFFRIFCLTIVILFTSCSVNSVARGYGEDFRLDLLSFDLDELFQLGALHFTIFFLSRQLIVAITRL